MPIDFPNFYKNEEGHLETMYGNRALKEKYLRDQALADRGTRDNERAAQLAHRQQHAAAQLAHRQQQAAMQGINRGIRGGGLNEFQRNEAERNLQKIAARGNEAIQQLPREQQLAPNLRPELNEGGQVVALNAPYTMFSGEKVLGNIQGAFDHDKAVAEKNYQEYMNKMNQEKQRQQQSKDAVQFIRNAVWGRR